jgi:hypothetical protein
VSAADKPECILPESSTPDSLETSAFQVNKCAPRFTGQFTDFKGVAIKWSKEMVWPKGAQPQEAGPFGRAGGAVQLMIAGLSPLPASVPGLGGEFKNEIIVVAVNQRTVATNADLTTALRAVPPFSPPRERGWSRNLSIPIAYTVPGSTPVRPRHVRRDGPWPSSTWRRRGASRVVYAAWHVRSR